MRCTATGYRILRILPHRSIITRREPAWQSITLALGPECTEIGLKECTDIIDTEGKPIRQVGILTELFQRATGKKKDCKQYEQFTFHEGMNALSTSRISCMNLIIRSEFLGRIHLHHAVLDLGTVDEIHLVVGS